MHLLTQTSFTLQISKKSNIFEGLTNICIYLDETVIRNWVANILKFGLHIFTQSNRVLHILVAHLYYWYIQKYDAERS